MNTNTSLITATFTAGEVTLLPICTTLKEEALAESALIGKVSNRQQNDACGRARANIKGILALLEKQRRELTDPALEFQRKVKRIVDGEKDELEKEEARLAELAKQFAIEEERLRREAEEAQRRELARIEAEKQAELLRIAREQAQRESEARRAQEETERKVREERESAERLAREATNQKQREAAAKAQAEAAQRAEAARIEAERIAAENQAKADTEAARVLELASHAAYIEAKPVATTKAAGQSIRKTWAIDQINDFQLMKARPDLIRKIEWNLVELKQALAENGGKLPGVIAHEELTTNQRAMGRVLDV